MSSHVVLLQSCERRVFLQSAHCGVIVRWSGVVSLRGGVVWCWLDGVVEIVLVGW